MIKIELPQPLRVLLIEDEDRFAQFVKRILEAYSPLNFIVARKNSVRETQEATEPQADVVILDLKRPNGEGLQLIEKMGRLGLPILVLTDHDFAENDALAWGAQEFLRKQDINEDGGLERLPEAIVRAFVRGRVLPHHVKAHHKLQELSKVILENKEVQSK